MLHALKRLEIRWTLTSSVKTEQRTECLTAAVLGTMLSENNMGKDAKIKVYKKALRAELDKVNGHMTPDQKERLYRIAEKKMLADLIYKKAGSKDTIA